MNDVTKTHNLEVSMTGEEPAQITDRLNAEEDNLIELYRGALDI